MRGSSRLALTAVALLMLPGLALAGGGGEFSEYQSKGWLWMYLGSFGAGFLTSLTPCVYPMIPITLGIFGARGADVSKARRLLLATAYVVGMGVTYAVLGVTFAMLGGSAGTLLANPFVVIPIVVLFIAMAASLFGAFELNLPASWQAKLNQVGGKGFGGAFAMGLVGGFIAAPCTGPFLAGLLAFVASTRDVVGGGSLLFVYALGMGVLFWVLAAAAMSLPKSGRWMDTVKSFGGALLLFGAIYFLRPLIPGFRTIASPEKWFLFASAGIAVVGLAIGALHASFSGGVGEKIRKGLGIALLLAGCMGMYMWKLTPKKHLPFEVDEKVAFEKARAQNKGVMVDFAATWCTPCEELELVFGDDEVYEAIVSDFVPIQFDVSELSDENEALKARYGAKTLPAVIFLDSEGNVVARLKDLVEVEEMLEILAPAKKKVRAARGENKQTRLPFETDEKTAFEKARAQNKGVMIDIAAEWCTACEELDRVFGNPEVHDAIVADFVPVKFDVTDLSPEDHAVQERYGAKVLPAVLFLDAQGTVLTRVNQRVEVDEMLAILAPAKETLRTARLESKN